MAWDEGLAQLMRDDLIGESISEKKMFGGLAFLLGGHMICGIHKGGAMFRVGKPNEAAALALPGVSQMLFSGKPMTSMVACSDDACSDDLRRGKLMAMALSFVKTLPPK